MTGLEDFRKEVISLGVSGKVVCLGGQSVYGGFSGGQQGMWVAGGSLACLTQHSKVD